MNRTHPQRSFGGILFDSTKSSSEERDRCQECSACLSCTRRCLCISIIALLALGVVGAVIGFAVTFGLPPPTPVNRFCVTSGNQTGFLCDDRVTCLSASQICNRIRECVNGEDEQEKLCNDLPSNLPGYLIFRCSNPVYWIYADKKCNGANDCGDCSDEKGTLANCPPCGTQWWSCTSVFFEYCTCIPRALCGDRIQHCSDWSDEYACNR